MQLFLSAANYGLAFDRHRGDYLALWDNSAVSKSRVESRTHNASYAEIIWDRLTVITVDDWTAARNYTP